MSEVVSNAVSTVLQSRTIHLKKNFISNIQTMKPGRARQRGGIRMLNHVTIHKALKKHLSIHKCRNHGNSNRKFCQRYHQILPFPAKHARAYKVHITQLSPFFIQCIISYSMFNNFFNSTGSYHYLMIYCHQIMMRLSKFINLT